MLKTICDPCAAVTACHGAGFKQEFEADAQACDKAADFAKCFERDRMQRALTDHATKLVIEELGRRLDRIEKRLDEIEQHVPEPSSSRAIKGRQP